jgi:hypothetical protein
MLFLISRGVDSHEIVVASVLFVVKVQSGRLINASASLMSASIVLLSSQTWNLLSLSDESLVISEKIESTSSFSQFSSFFKNSLSEALEIMSSTSFGPSVFTSASPIAQNGL